MISKQQTKKSLLVLAFTAFYLMQNATAQSWDINGNSGTSPATNYLGTSDNNNLIFRTNALERGRILGTSGEWQFGSTANYVKIDTSGNLRFNGKGDYLVGRNQYVFRFAENKSYGLFFNSTI